MPSPPPPPPPTQPRPYIASYRFTPGQWEFSGAGVREVCLFGLAIPGVRAPNHVVTSCVPPVWICDGWFLWMGQLKVHIHECRLHIHNNQYPQSPNTLPESIIAPTNRKRLCARRSLVASQRPCHTGSNQARRLEMRISNSTDEPNISHHRKGCNYECRHRLRKSTRVFPNLVRAGFQSRPSVLYWDRSNIRRHAVHSRGRIWMSGRPAACVLRLLGFALSAGLILIGRGKIEDNNIVPDSLLSRRGPHRGILKSVGFPYAAGIPMAGIARP